MRVVRNAATVLATSAVRIPIQFAASVVLTRYLSVDDRGLYALAFTFGTMLTVFVELGFGPASIYRLRRVGAPPSRVASNCLLAAFTLSAIAVLLCLPLGGWVRHHFLDDAPPEIFALALGIVPLQLLWIVGGSMARGLDRFALENGSLLLIHATRLAGFAVVLVAFAGALHEALVVFLATQALGTLVVLATVLRQTRLEPRADLSEIRASLAFGARAYVVRMAAGLHDRFDMFAIAYFLRDPQQAAFYAVARSLRGQLRLVPEAIGRALFPYLAGMPEESSAAQAARAVRHTMALVLLSMLAIGAAAPLVPVVYGAPYAVSIQPFLVLLVGMALFSMHRLFSNYFSGVGRQRSAVQSQLLTTGVNAVLNVALIPPMGIMGAAVANLASNATGAVFMTYAFCKDSGWSVSATLQPRREDLAFYRRHLRTLRRRLRGTEPPLG